jgi:EAL domain-containing protein (putative c-di-GMP-specific phosphodiesterase class I)
MLTYPEPTFTLQGTPYLEYLPVIDVSTGRLLGMEALVRWRHPTRGRISPDLLIPAAEASGDIVALTRWIVAAACEEACNWSRSIQLGVNCSVQQLKRGEVSQAVAEALRQTGLPSDQLNIEATEDAVVEPTASADLQAISDMGVQLSIDNVGTNWSSFEPFKRHAISTVKIDGSFIAGLESNLGINRLVVETVIHMAHTLGMSAIVERVENAAQLEVSAGFGADAAQGFFFSQPLARVDARMFAAGPDIPVFSRTEAQTLLLADRGAVPVASLLADVEPEPDASSAPPVPRTMPEVGARPGA